MDENKKYMIIKKLVETNGYYNILHQILINYGIPYKFFTDRRIVLRISRKNPILLKRIHSLNSVMPVSNSELRLKPAV